MKRLLSRSPTRFLGWFLVVLAIGGGAAAFGQSRRTSHSPRTNRQESRGMAMPVGNLEVEDEPADEPAEDGAADEAAPDDPGLLPPAPQNGEEADSDDRSAPDAPPRAPPVYSPITYPPPEEGWHTEYCGPACDGTLCADGYCGPNVLWGRIEFLLWWAKGMELPPLVSTDVLPGGTILLGDETVGDDSRPGGRGTIGLWMDDCHVWAVGVKWFSLGSETTSFDSRSTNEPTVGRPFFDVQQGIEQILIVNGIAPQLGQVAGHVTAETDADLFGGEIFLRTELHRTAVRRLDLMIGYQGTQIEEELRIRHNADQVNGNASFSAIDEFRTVSQFHGGEIGFILEYLTSKWMLEVIGKAGIGNMNQQVTIRGESTINGANAAGGLLALESNSGVFGKDEFSVVPEFNLTLGYFVTDRITINLGYSFIHWNNVVQAADQIDRVVNPALLPGPGQIPGADPERPRFRFNETDYWAHGLGFGVQVLY